MFRIVFYYNRGAEAKTQARAMTSKPDAVRLYDVSVWDGKYEKCDEVIVMPDVPDWQRRRVEKAYGRLTDQSAPRETDPAAIDHESPTGDQSASGNSDSGDSQMVEMVTPKTAVHMGAGRWFVMRGEEQISGPHSKTEAMRLSNE